MPLPASASAFTVQFPFSEFLIKARSLKELARRISKLRKNAVLERQANVTDHRYSKTMHTTQRTGFTWIHALLFVLAVALLVLLIPDFVKARSAPPAKQSCPSEPAGQ